MNDESLLSSSICPYLTYTCKRGWVGIPIYGQYFSEGMGGYPLASFGPQGMGGYPLFGPQGMGGYTHIRAFSCRVQRSREKVYKEKRDRQSVTLSYSLRSNLKTKKQTDTYQKKKKKGR